MLSSTTQPNEINLEGYQVVRSQYFSRATEPTMTLWNSAVGFSANTHEALNNCECIHIMVNEKDKKKSTFTTELPISSSWVCSEEGGSVRKEVSRLYTSLRQEYLKVPTRMSLDRY